MMQLLTTTWKRHVAKESRPRRDDSDRVGEYFADYSPLSADEIAADDPDAQALIQRSRVLSVKRGL